MSRTAKPLLDRIRDRCRVEPDTGCWIWTQGVNGKGLPVVKIGELNAQQPLLVRRLVHVVAVGPLAVGDRVQVRCRRERCVAPQCVEAANTREFNARLREQGCFDNSAVRNARIRARMMEQGRCKLDPRRAAQIRLRRAAGESTKALAAAFGVSRSTVTQIVAGRLWPATWPPPAGQ